ncbi:hypothetical protein NNRS527_00415 [Nitrosospira sp. NRS527]|nr:hypothetical protein NNRS527_00415 [Nitrosospira sp. NRS527]
MLPLDSTVLQCLEALFNVLVISCATLGVLAVMRWLTNRFFPTRPWYIRCCEGFHVLVVLTVVLAAGLVDLRTTGQLILQLLQLI